MAERRRAHRWKFYRAGGVDQVVLRNGEDLRRLRELDNKLWVAVAMPIHGVYRDPKTLAALDLDGDSRIRVPEILQTIEWLDATLVSLDVLFEGGDSLRLDALKDGPVRAAARFILTHLGRGDADRITLADVGETATVYAAARFNGDGIVPAETADEDATRRLIDEIITVLDPLIDRGGKPGIDRVKLDAFFAEVRLVQAWRARADANVLALGDATAAAATALDAVAAKIEDYFVRCQLAAFDPRAATALAGSDADLAALSALDLSDSPEPLRRLPLARVEAGRPLPLADGVNPAWAAELNAFVRDCVTPILGARPSLLPAEWSQIQTLLAPYRAWWAEKPVTAVERLGLDRVAALAAGDLETRVGVLIEHDLAVADESTQIAAVERLLLLQRDFVGVLRNFVNFADFYGAKGAAFQAGTLVLDRRSCHLCLEVTDVARHATLAPTSGAFLAYCECTRGAGEKMTIVAAFTDGDSDYLTVGRNGIFFDRKGRDWDATIVKIVSNPISIRESFWSPYKKVARFIEEQVGKRAAAAEADSATRLGSAARPITEGKKPEPSVAKKDERPKVDVGTVAAIGVAIGGIGAMFAGILAAFFGLGLWMPLGFLAVVLAISCPSMLLAYLKLRQRNLGPLLDANGWAINGRARINVPFGGALTDVAELPANAERSMRDPYAEKRRPWSVYFFLILLLALAGVWYSGRLDRYLPQRMRSTIFMPY
jgi:hypothetical protein